MAVSTEQDDSLAVSTEQDDSLAVSTEQHDQQLFCCSLNKLLAIKCHLLLDLVKYSWPFDERKMS